MNYILQKNNHSVFLLTFHLILVTKYRKKCINKNINIRLKQISHDIIVQSYHGKILSIESELDHIHILMQLKPPCHLSKLINSLKSVSSRKIRSEFKDHLKNFFFNKPVFWSPSFCLLSSGGAPINIIKQYISSQNSPKF